MKVNKIKWQVIFIFEHKDKELMVNREWRVHDTKNKTILFIRFIRVPELFFPCAEGDVPLSGIAIIIHSKSLNFVLSISIKEQSQKHCWKQLFVQSNLQATKAKGDIYWFELYYLGIYLQIHTVSLHSIDVE